MLAVCPYKKQGHTSIHGQAFYNIPGTEPSQKYSFNLNVGDPEAEDLRPDYSSEMRDSKLSTVHNASFYTYVKLQTKESYIP